MNTLWNLMAGTAMLLALTAAPVTVLAADITAPTTSAILSGTKGGDGWYTTAVTATLSAADEVGGSGVAKTEYSLDNVTWQTYSAPVVVVKDGVNSIFFRSTDAAGNVETPAKSSQIKINTTGQVGLWHMENNWQDSTVVGSNGAASYASFSTSAQVGGYAGSFNGTNAYVRVPDSPSLNATGAISIAFWIKPTVWGDGRSAGIVSKKANDSAAGYVIYNDGYYPGKINLRLLGTSGSYKYLPSNGNVDVGVWQQWVATYDPATSEVRWYKNGVLDKSTAGITVGNMSNATALDIGHSQTWNGYFNGLLDDVAIYGRALSATEVETLYRNTAVNSPTVNTVASPSTVSTITLRGTKQPNTAIAVNGTTVVPLDGATSWQASYALSQGSNTLSITALDAQNHNSLPVTRTVFVDSMPPQVTATTPTNMALLKTFSGAVTITLADALSPLDYAATVNNQTTVTTAAATTVSGTWSTSGSGTSGTISFIPVSALRDGTYTFVVRPTDGLGNSSNYTLAFTIDSTPPVAPVIGPVATPINTSSTAISGTKSSDSDSVIVSCAGALVGTVSYPTATTWSVTVWGLQQGSNTISAYALDAAGNHSQIATASVVVDTFPPSLASTTPVDGAVAQSNEYITATFSDNYAGVDLPASLAGAQVTNSGTAISGNWSLAGNALVFTPASKLPDGSYSVTLYPTDTLGNKGTATFGFTVDQAPPELLVSTLPDGSYTSNNTLNIAGSVTDSSGVRELTVNDAPVTVNPDGSFSYALVLKTGATAVTTVATDVVGNRSSDTRVITLDQTAPALVVASPADNSKTGSALLTVTGSVDETSVVVVKSGDTEQPAVQTGGAFSACVTLVPGYNTIYITATDLAGNQTALKRTILYDDQKPSVAITAPNQDVWTNQRVQVIRGMASDALTAVSVKITNGDDVYTPPVVDGAFEQAVNLTEQKTYGIVVTAINEVGTSTSVQRNVIYDTKPPALTIAPLESPTSQQALSITGTREAGTTVVVTCSSATVGAVSYPTDTTWEVAVTGLAEGENVVTAASTDAAGNSATVTAKVFVVTKAPEITLTTSKTVIWPPNHKLVPVVLKGKVEANGHIIKSVVVSVKDEYGKYNYSNLALGSTVKLEAWRNANDKDGRIYTITVVVTDTAGGTTSKSVTVTVPHNK